MQSFWPNNLDVIEQDPYFERTDTSLLTLAFANDPGGRALADAAGYEWISPHWPVTGGYVQDAHSLGLRVVPYTLDTKADIEEATRIGVDALITNDPRLARRAVAAASPKPAPMAKPPTRVECAEAEASELATPIESSRSRPQRPARLRHPVQAGPEERQDLRRVPHEDRVSDPRVRQTADGRQTGRTSSRSPRTSA